MAKIESKMEWVSNAWLFTVNGKYYMLDTGACCGAEIVADESSVGGFQADSGPIAQFALDFVQPAFEGKCEISGIFAGVQHLTYFLEGENVLIADKSDASAIAARVKGRRELHFLPFNSLGPMFPATIVKATVNGHDTQLFFDTGARMTTLVDDAFLKGLPQTGSVKDYVAMAGRSMTLPIFRGEVSFPCGLRRTCNLSYVRVPMIDRMVRETGGIVTGALGIDLLEEYDLLIRKDGVHLYERLAK